LRSVFAARSDESLGFIFVAVSRWDPGITQDCSNASRESLVLYHVSHENWAWERESWALGIPRGVSRWAPGITQGCSNAGRESLVLYHVSYENWAWELES